MSKRQNLALYDDHVLLQTVNSTVSDVREDIGYDAKVPERLFRHSPDLKLAYGFCNELTDIFGENISKSEAERKIRLWKILVGVSD